MAMLLNNRFAINDPDFITIAQHTGFLTKFAFPVWLQQYIMEHINERNEAYTNDGTCFLAHWLERFRSR